MNDQIKTGSKWEHRNKGFCAEVIDVSMSGKTLQARNVDTGRPFGCTARVFLREYVPAKGRPKKSA